MRILIAALALLSAGCGQRYTVAGAVDRPDSEVAIIEGYDQTVLFPFLYGRIEWLYIIYVDGGEHLPKTTTFRTPPPGHRCITVVWYQKWAAWEGAPLVDASPDETICFDTKAGHRYEIKHDREWDEQSDDWQHDFWVLDKSDGRVVADTRLEAQ